jgi:hypothetical protein
MSDIDVQKVVMEVANLIKDNTPYVVDWEGADEEPLFPTNPMDLPNPMSEIWDTEKGLSMGAIFYNEGEAEVFSDTETKSAGSVAFADPEFFEKIIDLVKGL